MNTSTAVAERVDSAPATTPMEMLDRAVANGASIETLTKLMDLQERWEKNQARKAFDEAMAEAKAEIPVIRKNRHVGFDSKKVGAARTDYMHETLDEIARVVTPILASHGLSYRFRTSSNPNEPVMVTCIISHRDGHSEENTLSAGRDESGNKNNIQAVGSTITYLQRYTLKAALGLAASNDDDAKAAGMGETINDDQVEELSLALIDAKIPFEKFFKVFGIAALSELPAKQFEEAKNEITNAIAARQKKQGAAA